MSEDETSTTTTATTDTDSADTGSADTGAADADGASPDAGDGEPPSLNLGPTYEEIQQELEKSPEKYEYGKSDDQDYVDRESIDFDPKDGLYTGTGTDEDDSDDSTDSPAAEAPETTEAPETADTTEGHDRPKPGPGNGEG